MGAPAGALEDRLVHSRFLLALNENSPQMLLLKLTLNLFECIIKINDVEQLFGLENICILHFLTWI